MRKLVCAPHNLGPEGCRDPRPQGLLQAGVADPTGPGLLLQVLRPVQRVLPLFTVPVQGLDQVDIRAGPEKAPEGRGKPGGSELEHPHTGIWGGTNP